MNRDWVDEPRTVRADGVLHRIRHTSTATEGRVVTARCGEVIDHLTNDVFSAWTSRCPTCFSGGV